MSSYPYFGTLPHRYSFACYGLSHVKSRDFPSRKAAEGHMHKICAKNGLRVEDVWDDHHDKTYCCDNGVKFYICRM